MARLFVAEHHLETDIGSALSPQRVHLIAHDVHNALTEKGFVPRKSGELKRSVRFDLLERWTVGCQILRFEI